MRVGITGGTGFMGTHLARRLLDDGHRVVLLSRSADERDAGDLGLEDAEFVGASVADRDGLGDAFADCDAVAHLAGINLERGRQTYGAVHVRGTENVVEAAAAAGVEKVILSSFLRARPDCGSAYHESKWAAEETLRSSGLDYTVFKAGVTYGRGDHMLTHVSRWLATVPVMPMVGLTSRRFRPLAIDDLVDVMAASLTAGRLSAATVPVVGPEELPLADGLRRIGAAIGRTPVILPAPVVLQYLGAWVQERIMETPIASVAQVRILSEGIVEPAPAGVCEPLPDDLEPDRPFTIERIRSGLGEVRPYGLEDLRW